MLWSVFSVPSVSGSRQHVRCRADFQSFNAALKTYAINAGCLPTTEQGREALVTRPISEPLPLDWVQITSSVPMDPWKHPYHYLELPAKDGVFRWELKSGGPDGIAGNEDDCREEFEWKITP